MKQRVSRRNRRTASTQAPRTRDLAILAISLVIFIGGSTSLAWAIHTQAPKDDEPAPPSTQHSTSQPSPYTGIIMPSTEPSTSSASEEPEGAQPAPDAAEQRGSPLAIPDESDEQATPTETPAPAPTPPSSNAGTQQGHVVHHTAYREQPVYRTVHHQASTAHEVTVAGKTHIEWTRCPVCGQRHASPYNERMLDHVTPVPCAACGCAHDTDYDEVVYG